MDPIGLIVTTSIVTAASGKLTEKVIDYLHDLLRNQNEEAKRKAAENARDFLNAIAQRVEVLERTLGTAGLLNQAADALSDPDFAVAFQVAVIAAARTGDSRRHHLLARAVTERLLANPESIYALAANMAIGILPNLSRGHLDFLGLGALVYQIRPQGIPLPSNPPATLPESRTITDSESKTVRDYAIWLDEVLRSHLADHESIVGPDYSHLVAASCLYLDPRLKRELREALGPFGERVVSVADASAWRSISDATLDSPASRGLIVAWERGLQHVVLTPAGLLIGIAVHDAKTGASTKVQIPETGIPAVSFHAGVWDGARIEPEFLEALNRQIEDWVDRRVGIWDRLRR